MGSIQASGVVHSIAPPGNGMGPEPGTTEEVIVRRAMVLVLTLAVLVPWGMSPANAAKHQRYKSEIYNAYWSSRKKIDSNTYVETTWYSGVYASGDNFWSDLYKSVDRCTKVSRRIRCHGVSYWYGDIRALGTGSFTIDRKLETGSFTGTYTLKDETNKTLIGTTTISVNLTGTGSISTYSDRETYKSGCRTFRYASKSKQRSATATGTYQIGSHPAKSFGSTSNAFMSRGSQLNFSKTC
jgi:hypothetical protein